MAGSCNLTRPQNKRGPLLGRLLRKKNASGLGVPSRSRPPNSSKLRHSSPAQVGNFIQSNRRAGVPPPARFFLRLAVGRRISSCDDERHATRQSAEACLLLRSWF